MLIRHSIIYLIGRIIPGTVGVITLAVFTRLLSIEQYGHYALIITTVGMFNTVFFQWLNLSLGRYLPVNEDQPDTILSTALIIYIGLILITGLLSAAVILFLNKTWLNFIVITLILSWAQSWFDLNLRISNSRLSPVLYGTLTSAKSLIAICAGVLFFFSGMGFYGILAGLFLALLFPTLRVIGYWRGFSFLYYNHDLACKFIRYGSPLTLTFMLIFIVDASDRFFIGWFNGANSVGIYAPAYDLAQQSIGMLMGIIHLAAFPLVLRALEEHGIETAEKQIKQNLVLLMGVALPATVGLVMLSTTIAPVVLGPQFSKEAGSIIPVISVAIFFSGIRSYYFDYSFQLSKIVWGQMWVVFWAALVNIALNLLWIPRYGLSGAAYATLAASVIALITSAVLGKKVFRLPPPHRDTYKIIVACIMMGACLQLLADWSGLIALILKIISGALVYIICCLILNIANVRSQLKNGLFSKKLYKPNNTKKN